MTETEVNLAGCATNLVVSQNSNEAISNNVANDLVISPAINVAVAKFTSGVKGSYEPCYETGSWSNEWI